MVPGNYVAKILCAAAEVSVVVGVHGCDEIIEGNPWWFISTKRVEETTGFSVKFVHPYCTCFVVREFEGQHAVDYFDFLPP